jgi:hypothetical protein
MTLLISVKSIHRKIVSIMLDTIFFSFNDHHQLPIPTRCSSICLHIFHLPIKSIRHKLSKLMKSSPNYNYLRQVSSFLRVLYFPLPIKLTATIHSWNIVESGVKYHKSTNPINYRKQISLIHPKNGRKNKI